MLLSRAQLAVTLLTLGAIPAAKAQTTQRGIIDGLVTDSALAPIRDAVISIEGVDVVLLTGVNGRFRVLALPPGAYDLRVRKLGMAPAALRVQVSPSDTARIAVTLEPLMVVLDSVHVTASGRRGRLSRFDERRARGDGQFMTAADIDRRNSVAIEDLIAPLKGISVRAGKPMNTRWGVTRTCPMQVFVDGVLSINSDISQLRGISPKDVEGIEVYTTVASIPLQYKSVGNAGACGVVLLWTRNGSQ